MSDCLVRAESLTKRYQIGRLLSGRRPALRETLSELPQRVWGAVARRPGRVAGEEDTDLWAVRDLSFEVARGEILGIVGPNGSGKSTVLRLASGITEPTAGWIATRGRVSTLLDVGVAFHPDLTGRENILLGGIILGMRAAEVRQRLDDIVDFAGVGRFVDTPVKRYSSGMYMRLAFAVAAHLEADVLLVDEVLAVGDLAFQERCLERINGLREQGRTVLFVTHSMSALRRLCSRALLLDGGRLVLEGSADEVARRYEGKSVQTRRPGRPVVALPPGAPGAAGRGLELGFLDAAGLPASVFFSGATWRARVDLEIDRTTPDALAAVTLGRADGTTVVTLASAPARLVPGRYRVELPCEVPLAPGHLVVGVEIWSGEGSVYRAEDAAVIEIADPEEGIPPPLRRGVVVGPRLAEIHPLGVVAHPSRL